MPRQHLRETVVARSKVPEGLRHQTTLVVTGWVIQEGFMPGPESNRQFSLSQKSS